MTRSVSVAKAAFVVHRPHGLSPAGKQFLVEKAEERRLKELHSERANGSRTYEGITAQQKSAPGIAIKTLNQQWCAA